MSGSEVDLTLVLLFTEEAVAPVAELQAAASSFAAGDPGAQASIADILSYVRSAAICAELISLSLVLDFAEKRAVARTLNTEIIEAAVNWSREAIGIPAPTLLRWDAERRPSATALLDRWADLPDVPPASVKSAVAPPQAVPAVDATMLELFRAELETHAFTMSDGLLALESDPAANDRLDAVMRAAHSIKGAVRMLSLDAAVTLAHAAEEQVQFAIRSQGDLSPGQIDALLAASDLLASLATVPDPTRFVAAQAADFAARERAVYAASEEEAEEESLPALPATHRSQVAAANLLAVELTQPNVLRADAGTPGLKKLETSSAEVVEEPLSRTVKVTAVHLDRLLGLAGEGVMDSRQLAPHARALHHAYLQQTAVLDLLSDLRVALGPDADAGAVGEILSRARAQAEHVRSLVAARHGEADTITRRTDELTRRLYRETIESRMRPFRDGIQWFPRLVRDVARKLQKNVQFRVVGEAIRVDRDILEKIEAPLNHLLRNALDHGVEPASERLGRGKSERATLTLEAKHWAGMLSVTVSDDGRGVDPQRVRQRVVERGLGSEAEVSTMSEPQLLEFLFAPGFSTRENVSEISGRGVGLDVVKTAVQEVGGSVRTQSVLGKGTSFQMLLPLTLSVTRAVIVLIADEHYALPLVRVHRLLRVVPDAVVVVEGRECIIHEQERIGLVSAAEVLGLEPKAAGAHVSVAVLRGYLGTFGLIVDSIVGEQDLVVRSLDPRLGRVADVLAAAVLPDGAPVLILDTEDLIRSTARLVENRRPKQTGISERRSRRRSVLIADDSVTVREVERQLFLANGFDVAVAVDGADAWQMVRERAFDLVVTDVDMPRMDGLELTRSIRRDERLQRIPVVVVSYRDRPQDKASALEAGATSYLAKSEFETDRLLALAIEVLEVSR